MKNLTFLIISFIAKYGLSLFRNKLVAIYLGPVGIGLQGLINSMTGWVTGLLVFGKNTTIVLDKAKEKKEDIVINLPDYFIRILVLGIILYTFTFFTEIFFDISVGWIEFSLIFSVFIALTTVVQAVIQASKRTRLYSNLLIISAIVNTIITASYLLIFREDASAIWIIAISTISPLLVYLVGTKDHLIWKRPEIHSNLVLNVSWKELTILLLSISGPLFYYLIRFLLEYTYDLKQVGYFTAVYSLASLTSAFVIKGMSIKMFPELVSVGENTRGRTIIIRNYLFIILAVYCILSPVIMFFDRVILTHFYSKDFVNAASGLRMMVVAQYFRSISFLVSYIAQVARKFRELLIIDVCSYLLCFHLILYWEMSVYISIIVAFGLMYFGYLFLVINLKLIDRWFLLVSMGLFGFIFVLLSKLL